MHKSYDSTVKPGSEYDSQAEKSPDRTGPTYPDVDPTATLLATAPAKDMAFPLQERHLDHHDQLRATLPHLAGQCV
jgi:hypothetical protein